MSVMKDIKIGKVVLNIGAGKDTARLEKGVKLLRNIAGKDPVKTKTTKRIAAWGIRPGLSIGCKITIRGDKTVALIKQLLEGIDLKLSKTNFDDNGNISFGIAEYIDIPGIEYDPEIGVIGLQVSIALVRPGYRVKTRRLNKAKIGKSHRINREEAIGFMKKEFAILLEEEE